MIVIMEHDATAEQVNKVIKYIEDKGLKVQVNNGETLKVVAVIGDKCGLNIENISFETNARSTSSEFEYPISNT